MYSLSLLYSGKMCRNIERGVFRASLNGTHFLILEVEMKNKIISILLIVSLLMLMLVSCDTLTDYESNSDARTSNNGRTTDDENESTEANKNEQPSQPTYAEDTVVNRFITEFNNNSGYDFTDIRKGNIKTKYFAYANDCYVEILNANGAYAECFSVSINGGKETSDRHKKRRTRSHPGASFRRERLVRWGIKVSMHSPMPNGYKATSPAQSCPTLCDPMDCM